MRDRPIPDLTFPKFPYGERALPIDLRILLYKGGAECNHRTVFNRIAAGELGGAIVERIELVKRIHEILFDRLAGGGACESTRTYVDSLRRFFEWGDQTDQSLSLDTAEVTFFHWCDFLLHRVRLKQLRQATAYGYAAIVSAILTTALDRVRPMICSTRLLPARSAKRAVGVAADKRNLADTFAFGHLCLDVANSLSQEAIFGALPVAIRLRDGRVIEHWSGMRNPKKLATLQTGYKLIHNTERTLQRRTAIEGERSLRRRFPLINLRIFAELFIFIGQTGMNYSQAYQLRVFHFSYKSTIDGYEVREYKNRRKGEVLFEIFADYKEYFERYLAWRQEVFPGETTDLLFPLIRQGSHNSTPPNYFNFAVNLCKPLGIPFLGPQALRNIRVNWLLRESRNPDQTAEQAQHTKQTLLRIYEKPSLQVAQIEIVQFWKKSDPRLGGNPMPCPAPGVCDGVPESVPDLPPEIPKPNCIHLAGCLFCLHHRDIDSLDYVCSVASMRHLQTIILKRFRPASKGRVDAAIHVESAIEVLTAKLKWFSDSNAKRRAWVDEALEQVAEADFHPHWRYLIESAEGV